MYSPYAGSMHTSSAQPTTYRLMLNDHLQRWRPHEHAQWTEQSSGRRERPTWTVTCYLSNIPYGSGTARSKTDAKEEAARKTLDIIQRQHVAVNCVAGFQWATNQNSSSSSYPSSSSRKPTTTTQRTTSTSTSHRYVHPNQAPQSSQTSQTYGYGYSYAYPYTTSHGYVYPGNH